MRNLRGTYVHRGDAARRRRRIKQFLFASASITMTTVVIATRKTTTANAEPATGPRAPLFSLGENRKLRDELQSAKGELSLVRAQFERADKIMQYSTKYAIPAGMAGKVFDASLREGIDPELAFRLVRLESEFNEKAVSKVGAVGLTQLMPSTAVLFEKGANREKLFQGETNLRIGFHYLRTLLDMYKGDVRLALLAYNRGEDAVWRDVKNGVNPGNGYDRWVMKDYKGKGLLPTQ
ncbi:MAG TPA: transglycosylase SLT domain-containing protein [Gemmatimonadaceae bacterium]|jgi:soluble lytic murein transglycosylase-like protein